MNETLRLLYDKFYTPLPMVESEQEVEVCHRQLIERLDKPERKLVLQIIDAQNLMIEQRSAVPQTPNHNECIRCGACITACPTQAIHYQYGCKKQKTEETK